jgi:tRNA uracil 4-sulfurtransferase
MQQSIIIHYGEIGLKGKNQIDFINQLMANIELKLKDLMLDWEVIHPHGYVTIEIPYLNGHPEPVEGSLVNNKEILNSVLDEISKVFGIVWFALVQVLRAGGKGLGIEEIEEKILKMANDKFEPDKTFAIRAHRTDKTYPLNSHEIEVKLGKAVQDKTKWDNVDLEGPDQTFYIDIHKEITHIYSQKLPGPGGLPVSSAGRVLSLLSGGLDSPVAAYLIAKRGTSVDLLHFAATHMQIKEAKDYLISNIAQQLSKYTLNSRLFIVPYTHFNLSLIDKRINYELVLFRRFMMRVAEQLARVLDPSHPELAEGSPGIRRGTLRQAQGDQRIQALVTGDNLAQVASQTLSNLASTAKAIEMPILRPLITYDKNETVELARKIDTFDLSTKPYKDCCSLISQNPKTTSDHDALAKLEQDILPNYQEIIDKTLNEIVVLEYKNGQLLT